MTKRLVEVRAVPSVPMVAGGTTLDHFVSERATAFSVLVFRTHDGDGPDAVARMRKIRDVWRAQGLPKALVVALPPDVGFEVHEGEMEAREEEPPSPAAAPGDVSVELRGTFLKFAATVREPGCCGCAVLDEAGREIHIVRCACGCGLVAPYASEGTVHWDGRHWRVHHLLEYALRVVAATGGAQMEAGE